MEKNIANPRFLVKTQPTKIKEFAPPDEKIYLPHYNNKKMITLGDLAIVFLLGSAIASILAIICLIADYIEKKL